MNRRHPPKMPIDTGPLSAAMAFDPELSLAIYTIVADQGKLALAGIGPTQAAHLIREAVLGGKLDAADSFAEACIQKNDYGLAVIDGYELARGAGSSHLFNPSFNILYHSPLAAQFARCLSIKISGFYFWNHFTGSPDAWTDDLSLAAIEIRTSQTIETSRIPASALEKAVQSPACLVAIMTGIASRGCWSEAETLLEMLADRKISNRAAVDALIAPLLQFWSAYPSTNIMGVISRLSLLSAPAAESLARAVGAEQLDLGGFQGFLPQPGDDAGQIGLDCCFDWRPVNLRERIGPSFPVIMLSAGEIMAHWTSEKGASLARAAGFSKSPRSEAIFERLRQFSMATTIGEREALLEALSLADAAELTSIGPGKSPRL